MKENAKRGQKSRGTGSKGEKNRSGIDLLIGMSSSFNLNGEPYLARMEVPFL